MNALEGARAPRAAAAAAGGAAAGWGNRDYGWRQVAAGIVLTAAALGLGWAAGMLPVIAGVVIVLGLLATHVFGKANRPATPWTDPDAEVVVWRPQVTVTAKVRDVEARATNRTAVGELVACAPDETGAGERAAAGPRLLAIEPRRALVASTPNETRAGENDSDREWA